MEIDKITHDRILFKILFLYTISLNIVFCGGVLSDGKLPCAKIEIG